MFLRALHFKYLATASSLEIQVLRFESGRRGVIIFAQMLSQWPQRLASSSCMALRDAICHLPRARSIQISGPVRGRTLMIENLSHPLPLKRRSETRASLSNASLSGPRRLTVFGLQAYLPALARPTARCHRRDFQPERGLITSHSRRQLGGFNLEFSRVLRSDTHTQIKGEAHGTKEGDYKRALTNHNS